MRRMAPKPWIDPNALGRLEAGANPLADICGRARAERRGEVYTPEPAPQVIQPPLVEPPPVRTEAPPAVSLRPTSLSIAFIVGANRQLSGPAFKVLMAIAAMGDGCYTAMQLANATRTHRDTILKAVIECLDFGWLERRVLCSLCETEEEAIDDGRHIPCSRCRRNVPVKHAYRVLCPLEEVADNFRNPAVDIRNPAEIDRNPLPRKTATPAEIIGNPAEENRNPAEENRQGRK